MKKSLLLLATTSILVAAGCSNPSSASSTTSNAVSTGDVAKVGDDVISFEEYYKKLKEQAGIATLRSMIVENLLSQSVDNAEELRKQANEEVDAQIEKSGGEQVFAQLLAYQKLGSIEEFRESVYVRNLFQAVIEKNTDTSEEVLKAYYENGYAPLMEAQHILVETEDEAKDILKRLEAGEEFDALAKELSLDSTAQNGGLLTPFKSGTMVTEFEEAVKSVGNGELVDHPVQSKYGYHIIRVINNGEKKPYEEVKEEVRQAYLESQYNNSAVAYSIVGKLIEEKKVEILDKDLQAALEELMAAVQSAKTQLETANQTTTADDSTTVNEETSDESDASQADSTEASSEAETTTAAE